MRKRALIAAGAISIAFIAFVAQGLPTVFSCNDINGIFKEWYVDLSGVDGIDLEELIGMASELPLQEKHALLESYGAVVTKLQGQGESEYTEYGIMWVAGKEGVFSPEQLGLMKKARNFQELCLPEEWYVDLSGVKGIGLEELIGMALELPLQEKHALLKSYGAVVTRLPRILD